MARRKEEMVHATLRVSKMDKIKSFTVRLLRDEEGQDIIEYGLVAAFISVVLAAILLEFSTPLNAIYEHVLAGVRLVPS